MSQKTRILTHKEKNWKWYRVFEIISFTLKKMLRANDRLSLAGKDACKRWKTKLDRTKNGIVQCQTAGRSGGEIVRSSAWRYGTDFDSRSSHEDPNWRARNWCQWVSAASPHGDVVSQICGKRTTWSLIQVGSGVVEQNS